MTAVATMPTGEEYGNAFDQVAAYIAADKLDINEKKVLVDFLNSEFRSIRPDDLLDAVKGAISGRFEPKNDISRIRRLSTGWFGSILQGFKTYRQNEKRRNPLIEMDDRKRLEIGSAGLPGRESEYYDTLKRMYFNSGCKMPFCFAWKSALSHARTLPDYNVKVKDKALIQERARAYCSKKQGTKGLTFSEKSKVTDNDIDREVLRLHFERMTRIE